MVRLEINPINPQARLLERAIAALKDGALVIYPTDTVYGLGCDLFSKKAIERIYHIKGKQKRMRLSLLCPDLKNIATFAHVSTPAYKIMRRLLPGPYTFILEATRVVPKIFLEKRKTIGIRVPDNVVCRSILGEFGRPLVNTSARLPQQELLNSPDDIVEAFSHTVDFFLDSGAGGLKFSSVIDLTGDIPTIIREGKGFDKIVVS